MSARAGSSVRGGNLDSGVTRSVSFAGRYFNITDDTVNVPSDEPCLGELQRIKPGDIFVDVGAGNGAYTLPALAMGATVIAFEPSDASIARLRQNLIANRWLSQCVVYKVALGDGEPLPDSWVASVFGKDYPATNVVESTIDAKVSGRIDWLKIDVEGLELAVLQGARGKLARYRPWLIIEDHDGICPDHIVSDYPASIDSSKRIHAMLEGLGYRIEVRPFDVSRKYIVASA